MPKTNRLNFPKNTSILFVDLQELFSCQEIKDELNAHLINHGKHGRDFDKTLKKQKSQELEAMAHRKCSRKPAKGEEREGENEKRESHLPRDATPQTCKFRPAAAEECQSKEKRRGNGKRKIGKQKERVILERFLARA